MNARKDVVDMVFALNINVIVGMDIQENIVKLQK